MCCGFSPESTTAMCTRKSIHTNHTYTHTRDLSSSVNVCTNAAIIHPNTRAYHHQLFARVDLNGRIEVCRALVPLVANLRSALQRCVVCRVGRCRLARGCLDHLSTGDFCLRWLVLSGIALDSWLAVVCVRWQVGW